MIFDFIHVEDAEEWSVIVAQHHGPISSVDVGPRGYSVTTTEFEPCADCRHQAYKLDGKKRLSEETLRKARELIDAGYYSTSNKYRNVSRIPDGKSAYDLLIEVEPSWKKHFESHAKSILLRSNHAESLELDQDLFEAFRRLGGQPA